MQANVACFGFDGFKAVQGYSWAHSEITGPMALNRAVEVSGSAAGGVAGARSSESGSAKVTSTPLKLQLLMQCCSAPSPR